MRPSSAWCPIQCWTNNGQLSIILCLGRGGGGSALVYTYVYNRSVRLVLVASMNRSVGWLVGWSVIIFHAFIGVFIVFGLAGFFFFYKPYHWKQYRLANNEKYFSCNFNNKLHGKNITGQPLISYNLTVK